MEGIKQIKSIYIRKYIITICLVLMLFVTVKSAFADYQIDDDTVFVNDSNVYLSASPHTLRSDDGEIRLKLNSKVFSGNINVVFGYDNTNIKPKSFLVKRIGINVNGSNYTYYTDLTPQSNAISFNYGGMNTWRYVSGLNINANQDYDAIIDFEQIPQTYGKYWICVYPTSYGTNLGLANNNGHLYCLDPWYNVSTNSTVVLSGLTNGLKIYYTMDETSGNLIDSLGYSNGLQQGTIGRASGVINKSRGTYSSGNWFGTASTLIDTDLNATVNFWVMFNTSGSVGGTAFYGGGGYGSEGDPIWYVLRANRTGLGQWYFRMDKWGDAGFGCTINNYNMNSGQWYMITTMNKDTKNNRTMVINGNFSTSCTDTNIATSSFPSQAWEIGYNKANEENPFGGYIDEFGFWDRILNVSELQQLYNDGSGLSYRNYTITNYFTILAFNNRTNSSILNFNATVNGLYFATTEGVLVTNFSYSDNATILLNISINSLGFEGRGYVNYNWSSNSILSSYLQPKIPSTPSIFSPYDNLVVNQFLNITFNQSIPQVGGILYYNITLLNNDDSLKQVLNITTNLSYYWNTYANNLSLGTYKIRVEAVDTNNFKVYDTHNVTILANSSSAYVTNAYLGSITGFHILLSNYANITDIRLNYSNTIYNSFNYTLISNILDYTTNINTNNIGIRNYTWNISVMQDNGTLEYFLLNGSFSIIGYTLNLSFFEEITKNIFKPSSYPNVTLYITSILSNYSYSNTNISTGVIGINSSIPYGELLIRYSGLGNTTYLERTYYLIVTSNSSLNLYLINNTVSQTVRFQVKDVYGTSLSNIMIKLLRYYVNTNSYETVEVCKTDINGNCYMQLQLATSTNNGEFYKLIFQSGDTIFLESQPSKIYDTILYYQLQTTESTLVNYNNNLNLAYDITFNPSTNNFDFTWSNGMGGFVGGCLYVYRTIGLTRSLYNSNCVNSTASTILINIDNSSKSTYEAKAYAYYGSTPPYFLGSLFQSFKSVVEKNNIGKTGLFLAFIVILVFALISLFSAVIGIILTLVALVFFTWIGFINIGLSFVIGICFSAIVIIMVNKRG